LNADPSSLLWHYTVAARLRQILASGVIRRSAAGLRKGERAGVWFSHRDTWEPTATKWLRGSDGQFRPATMEEMGTMGLARFGVDSDVVRTTWAQHRRFGGLPWPDGDAIERNARHQGADPDGWRVSYRDVPRTRWRRIETSSDGLLWTPVDGLDVT
jgi:hypothetical protein